MLRKQKKLRRNREVHNFNTAKEAAIVFDTPDHETFRHIRAFSKYLEEFGIRTRLLGYIDSDEIPGDLLLWENCQVISRKDLDYFFRPKDAEVLGFIDRDFDIMFNLSKENYFPITYITTLSRAKFKVGRYSGGENNSDFMINISSDPSVEFLIAQVKNYVSILNNQKEAGKISTK
ncbi:MAG TPA: hypothetical protein VE870_15150 [Bacteroidales bacterium]|nr:hypothetical protein [Bacteroidales bacterium]